MKRQLALGLTFALLAALSGCGGGGSTDTTSPSTTPPSATGAKVAGPLDAIQDPITNQIIGPLSAATAGTPLQGVILCANRIVVLDALDGVDSIAVAIQATDPTALASAATAANLQNQLQNLVVHLNGLLTAMTGSASACSSLSAPTGGNPLSGTPLAAVGDQLAPVLAQIYDAVSGASAGSRPALPLSTLVGLYAQLNAGVQSAMAQLPASVTSAPVLGGVIAAIKTSMVQLSTVVTAASLNNSAVAQTAVATALNTIVKGVLLNVVPVSAIETQAGHPGVLSTPISTAVDSITAQLGGGNLNSLDPATLQAALASATAAIVTPEQAAILAKITGPLTAALAGINAPAGNPLSLLTTALTAFLNGSPAPLGLITGVIEQVVGLGGTCPVLNTPLASLCSLHLGLPF